MAMARSSTSNKGTIVRVLLILVAAVILFSLIAYYNTRTERFSSPPPPAPPLVPVGSNGSSSPAPFPTAAQQPPAAPKKASGPAPMGLEPVSNEGFLGVGPDPFVGTEPSDPFPQDRITPDQLLPKDAANSTWAQANPAGMGDVKDQSFLTAGYHIGYDSQGSSLRNASHDLRAAPANPRYRVSIWSNSTISPDDNIKNIFA